MDSQNILNPLGCGCAVSPCGCGGGNAMLIDRLIGNAYEIVKYVACNMAKISLVYDWLQAGSPGGSSGGGGSNIVATPAVTPVIALNLTTSNVQQLTLTTDVTASSITDNAFNPSLLVLRFIQDAT